MSRRALEATKAMALPVARCRALGVCARWLCACALVALSACSPLPPSRPEPRVEAPPAVPPSVPKATPAPPREPASPGTSVSAPVPPPPAPGQRPAPATTAAPVASPGVIASNERLVIYVAKPGDSLRSLARQFLADESRWWEIADFNGIRAIRPGELLIIPLLPPSPFGVSDAGYQTVPILSYHRFGHRDGKMVVTTEAFSAQLDYLAKNGYRVVRLSDLTAFLQGKRALPRRAVVITIDDGYQSAYVHAFPLLQKHGFPATIFVYTDFIGARDALNWRQMKEMVASGLIDIESHSKTHTNLAYRMGGESDEAYRRRLDNELIESRRLLRAGLGVSPTIFAYPYGDANTLLLERLQKADYRLAVTVNPGGNAFFTHPLLLQRTMIFGDYDLETFKSKLQVFRQLPVQ